MEKKTTLIVVAIIAIMIVAIAYWYSAGTQNITGTIKVPVMFSLTFLANPGSI